MENLDKVELRFSDVKKTNKCPKTRVAFFKFKIRNPAKNF